MFKKNSLGFHCLNCELTPQNKLSSINMLGLFGYIFIQVESKAKSGGFGENHLPPPASGEAVCMLAFSMGGNLKSTRLNLFKVNLVYYADNRFKEGENMLQ